MLRRLTIGSGICALLWLAGFVWFATPPGADTRTDPTDAIVVLTGGSLRLQAGIELLREGRAPRLFVSGVNQQVDLEDLLRSSKNVPDWTLCCIVLGYHAENTFDNAQETAQWIRSQGFHSLRLVTAWYHMPRSLLEFDRALKEVEIIAHPVFPDQVKQERWWMRPSTANLLVGEYVKYLGALSRPLFEWRQPPPHSPAEPARAEMP